MTQNSSAKNSSAARLIFGCLCRAGKVSRASIRPNPVPVIPVQTAWNLFTSDDGHFHTGIWESKPGKWRCIFTESEFCQILSGVLIVTGDDGQKATYRAGDAFVSPAGFTGTWEVVETVRKHYAYYE